MKVLYSINCFSGGHSATNEAAIIFPSAWARFIRKNRDRLLGDFQFLNYGINHDLLERVAGDIPVRHMTCTYIPSDSDQTFDCIDRAITQYDYVARVDPDMFPSVDALNKMFRFLEENRETNILSPGNMGQAFHQNLYPNPHPTNNWEPFGHPTVGNCIVFFDTLFTRWCIKEYNQRLCKSLQGPFSTSQMTYGQICKLLGKDCDPSFSTLRVGLDGQITSDMWAIMCSKGIRQAWIVNHDNRSFHDKEHTCIRTMKFNTFDEIVDRDDISGHLPGKRLKAPFLHLGDGSSVFYHFNLHNNPPGRGPEHVEDYLKSFYVEGDPHDGFGTRSHMAIIIRMLTEAHGDETLLKQLNTSITKSVELSGATEVKYGILEKKVREFFGEPLKEYL